MTTYAAEWFERAKDDLRSLEVLSREKGPPNTICFLAQQAAEKYLKGFLASHERHVRKSHDLVALVTLCSEIDASFAALQADARFLTQFYTDARYPAETPSFTVADAEDARTAVRRIHEFIAQKLRHTD